VCATERGERKCVFGTFENLTTTKFGKVDGTVIRTSIIVICYQFSNNNNKKKVLSVIILLKKMKHARTI
jgi:hypothetical protein